MTVKDQVLESLYMNGSKILGLNVELEFPGSRFSSPASLRKNCSH